MSNQCILLVLSISLLAVGLIAGCAEDYSASSHSPNWTPPVRAYTNVTSPNTVCGEMVYCNQLPADSGIAAFPSQRCDKLAKLITEKDPVVVECNQRITGK